MPLLGKAAVAMWWDMAPAHREEFEHWHSHEHLPERLGIPGFLRGSRWASAEGGHGLPTRSGDGFFVMYELAEYATLCSDGYLARLNQPTPWSVKMMPHHSNMVRSQCHVLESRGGGVAAHALTVRLSPAQGRDDALRSHLAQLGARLAVQPGIAAFHLLRNETPKIATTTEQQIRGGRDAAADWVIVAEGYGQAALEALGARELSAASLMAAGAREGAVTGLYRLSHAAIGADW